jgi:APA family basic amino acid/polyamine antiporter
MAKGLTMVVLAMLFSFAIVYGSGDQAVMLLMLVGVPVYIWVKAKRGRYGPDEVLTSRATI